MISKPNLFHAARVLGNSQPDEKVEKWCDSASKNNFATFVELQSTFPCVDLVGDKLVFNLGAYRLICRYSFLRKTLFFKAPLAHHAYDQVGWQ